MTVLLNQSGNEDADMMDTQCSKEVTSNPDSHPVSSDSGDNSSLALAGVVCFFADLLEVVGAHSRQRIEAVGAAAESHLKQKLEQHEKGEATLIDLIKSPLEEEAVTAHVAHHQCDIPFDNLLARMQGIQVPSITLDQCVGTTPMRQESPPMDSSSTSMTPHVLSKSTNQLAGGPEEGDTIGIGGHPIRSKRTHSSAMSDVDMTDGPDPVRRRTSTAFGSGPQLRGDTHPQSLSLDGTNNHTTSLTHGGDKHMTSEATNSPTTSVQSSQGSQHSAVHSLVKQWEARTPTRLKGTLRAQSAVGGGSGGSGGSNAANPVIEEETRNDDELQGEADEETQQGRDEQAWDEITTESVPAADISLDKSVSVPEGEAFSPADEQFGSPAPSMMSETKGDGVGEHEGSHEGDADDEEADDDDDGDMTPMPHKHEGEGDDGHHGDAEDKRVKKERMSEIREDAEASKLNDNAQKEVNIVFVAATPVKSGKGSEGEKADSSNTSQEAHNSDRMDEECDQPLASAGDPSEVSGLSGEQVGQAAGQDENGNQSQRAKTEKTSIGDADRGGGGVGKPREEAGVSRSQASDMVNKLGKDRNTLSTLTHLFANKPHVSEMESSEDSRVTTDKEKGVQHERVKAERLSRGDVDCGGNENSARRGNEEVNLAVTQRSPSSQGNRGEKKGIATPNRTTGGESVTKKTGKMGPPSLGKGGSSAKRGAATPPTGKKANRNKIHVPEGKRMHRELKKVGPKVYGIESIYLSEEEEEAKRALNPPRARAKWATSQAQTPWSETVKKQSDIDPNSIFGFGCLQPEFTKIFDSEVVFQAGTMSKREELRTANSVTLLAEKWNQDERRFGFRRSEGVKLSDLERLKSRIGQHRDVSNQVFDTKWTCCGAECDHNSAIRQPWFKKIEDLPSPSPYRGGAGGGATGMPPPLDVQPHNVITPIDLYHATTPNARQAVKSKDGAEQGGTQTSEMVPVEEGDGSACMSPPKGWDRGVWSTFKGAGHDQAGQGQKTNKSGSSNTAVSCDTHHQDTGKPANGLQPHKPSETASTTTGTSHRSRPLTPKRTPSPGDTSQLKKTHSEASGSGLPSGTFRPAGGTGSGGGTGTGGSVGGSTKSSVSSTASKSSATSTSALLSKIQTLSANLRQGAATSSTEGTGSNEDGSSGTSSSQKKTLVQRLREPSPSRFKTANK